VKRKVTVPVGRLAIRSVSALSIEAAYPGRFGGAHPGSW
jgi:hypothetical protein